MDVERSLSTSGSNPRRSKSLHLEAQRREIAFDVLVNVAIGFFLERLGESDSE